MEKKRLKNIATISYGKSPKEILSDDGIIPVIGTGGVERFGDDYLFDGESIILGRKGTIDRPIYVDTKFWAIDTTFYLHDFKETNVAWLYYFLNTIDLRSMSEGTGVPSISRDSLHSIEVVSPDLSDQEKIAAVLACVDKAIEQTERVIEKQTRIKKGLLYDLFTRGMDENGVRRSEATHEFIDSALGRIPKTWQVTDLGTLAIFEAGFAFKNNQLAEHGYKIVRISNLHKSDYPYWHYQGQVKENWLVRDGELLFSWAGVASSIDCYIYRGETALLNQHIYNLKIADDEVRFFVYQYLKFTLPAIRQEIEGGAGQLHLTKNKIKNINIPRINTEELVFLNQLIRRADKLVENNIDKRNKLVSIRNGLMQDLLTENAGSRINKLS